MSKNITLYKRATYDPKNPEIGISISLNEYFSGVLNGRWQDDIFRWRSIKDDTERKNKKRYMLPAVTVSGEFSGRNDADIVSHTGLLCIDIDQKDNEKNLIKCRDELREIPEIAAIHLSVSGSSLAVYFKIQPNKHKESFEAITRMLANDYELIADMSCSNVSRLRFVSYDPDLYLNMGADTWRKFLPKPKKSEITPSTLHHHIHTDTDIKFVIDQIISRRINIYNNYYEWLRVGFAIADKLGEGGRSYFVAISQFWHEKHKTNPDRQYTRCLRNRHGVTIATFFYYAKQAGCEITSKRTSTISTIGKLRRKQEKKNGGNKDGKKEAIDFLKKSENIEGEDVAEVLEQVWSMPESDLDTATSKNTLLEEIEAFLRSNWDFKYNEITGIVEVDGVQIDDMTMNNIYLECLRVVDEKIKKNLIECVIHSSFSTPYNEIKDFIKENETIESSGNIKRLAECIESDIHYVDSTFIEYFLEKWLLGMIGSIYGVHSVTKLTLTGKKMGIGKSKFFQHLLPEKLSKKYFFSDPLGKTQQDIAIQLTSNLLIFDDENKDTSEGFKALSDQSTFTVRLPYGRFYKKLNRLGVFCGTSNNDAVIDDYDNRRIIAISVNNIDLNKYHAIDKTELFIECYKIWESGKKYFLDENDIARLNEVTSSAFEVVEEYEFIRKYFEPSQRGDIGAVHLMSSEIASFLKTQTGMNNISSKKIARIMRQYDFPKSLETKGGTRMWGFWVKQIDGNKQVVDDMPF